MREEAMQELLPIAFGALLGVLFGLAPTTRLRFAVPAAMIVVFGVVSTVVTGEFRISWAFLLIDIPLVAIAAAVAFVLERRIATSTIRTRW
jgi:hypothetical protein